MKAKRGAKRSNTTIAAIAIGMVLISLGFLAGIDYVIKNWAGYVWDKALVEKSLGTPLPADAHDIQFGSHRGRGGKLSITFEASYESVDAFVSHFCEGKLYQSYDPFNAIDTRKHHEGAYFIIMDQSHSYYSYSLNTPDKLFGIRCLSDGLGQIQILVDKTSPDTALLKMESLFTCRNCIVPEPTLVPTQQS